MQRLFTCCAQGHRKAVETHNHTITHLVPPLPVLLVSLHQGGLEEVPELA